MRGFVNQWLMMMATSRRRTRGRLYSSKRDTREFHLCQHRLLLLCFFRSIHPASANRDRSCNPLRLREELLRKRSRRERDASRFRDKRNGGGSRSDGSGSGVGETAGGSSKLIVETLLPRLAGERV